MRVGVMIGPERGDAARKVARMLDDVAWRRAPAWTPRGCRRSRGTSTPDRGGAGGARSPTRIELGTAIVPVQTAHPIAFAQQALPRRSPRRPVRARVSGRRTTGSSRSARPALRAPGSPNPRLPRGPARGVRRTRARRRGERHVTVHNPIDVAPRTVADPVAALGPIMLRSPESRIGTVLWMADERAIGGHVVPRITAAARTRAPRTAGGRGRSGRLCAAARSTMRVSHANQILGACRLLPELRADA